MAADDFTMAADDSTMAADDFTMAADDFTMAGEIPVHFELLLPAGADVRPGDRHAGEDRVLGG